MKDSRPFDESYQATYRQAAGAMESLEQVAAMEAAGELINRKWKLAILYLLARAPHRYNALLRTMPGVTPKMLTQQLRSLEDAGVVAHIHGPGRATHTEYRLTTLGVLLRPTIDTLASFARDHLGATRASVAHHVESPFRRAG